MKKRESGVLTIEASIVLCVTILLVLFLFNFARFYRAENMISHATLQAADSVALESYVRESSFENDEQRVLFWANRINGTTTISEDAFESLRTADIPTIVKEKFTSAVAASTTEADSILDNLGVLNGLNGIDFSESKMELTTNDVVVKASYTLKMKFPVFGMSNISLTKSAKAKTVGEILFNINVIPEDDMMGSTSGSGKYKQGTEVNIKAFENYGFEFISWDDGNGDINRKIIVDDAKTYIAKFERKDYGITLEVDNGNGTSTRGENTRGKVTSALNSAVSLGGNTYPYQSTVHIKTEKKDGYYFDGWDGTKLLDNGSRIEIHKSASETEFDVYMDATYKFVAKYKPYQHTINVNTDCDAAKDVIGVQRINNNTKLKTLTLEYGNQFKLYAPTLSGYSFDGWYNGSTKISGERTPIVNVPLGNANSTPPTSGSTTYTAKYIVIPSISLSGGGTGQNSTQLTATTVPAGQTVYWESSNSSVLTVNNGTVTAIGSGGANITAYFNYNGQRYKASKWINASPSVTVFTYTRRDGFNSSNTGKSTKGPWCYNYKNSGGMRFYYNYNPGPNNTDKKYGNAEGTAGVQYGELAVEYSRLKNAKIVKSGKKFTKNMIVHDVATTGPYAGVINPQIGYNASRQDAYIFYNGNYDLLYFVKECHAPKPGGGYYDYYISYVG